jgi:hypothetical protein
VTTQNQISKYITAILQPDQQGPDRRSGVKVFSTLKSISFLVFGVHFSIYIHPHSHYMQHDLTASAASSLARSASDMEILFNRRARKIQRGFYVMADTH